MQHILPDRLNGRLARRIELKSARPLIYGSAYSSSDARLTA
jgi:hypothetical protein